MDLAIVKLTKIHHPSLFLHPPTHPECFWIRSSTESIIGTLTGKQDLDFLCAQEPLRPRALWTWKVIAEDELRRCTMLMSSQNTVLEVTEQAGGIAEMSLSPTPSLTQCPTADCPPFTHIAPLLSQL